MPNILHEVTIEASPDKVYEAITTQDGASNWWTIHTKAEPKEGTVSEFGFYGGQVVFKMLVDTLEPARKVAWDVEQGAPDGSWADTRVTWDLTPVENGTKVLLAHRGFASEDGNYANVSYNWAWFLTSLKAYLETGTGTPNTN